MSATDREARDRRDTHVGFDLLPVREQLLDRLADLMLDTDDVLDVLGTEAAGELRRIAPDVRDVFDMERLSD
jgi:hypothetical protein